MDLLSFFCFLGIGAAVGHIAARIFLRRSFPREQGMAIYPTEIYNRMLQEQADLALWQWDQERVRAQTQQRLLMAEQHWNQQSLQGPAQQGSLGAGLTQAQFMDATQAPPPPSPNIREYLEGSERAMTLLMSWLTPEQKKDYQTYQHFTVIGCHTGTLYRIRALPSYGVEEMNGGYRRRSLCFVPSGQCGAFYGDIMLAQKIMLETNEHEALRVANFH